MAQFYVEIKAKEYHLYNGQANPKYKPFLQAAFPLAARSKALNQA